MILKTFTLALTLSVVWVNYVCGAPYSNVYVQREPEVLPVEYFQYGSPSFPIVGEQYAQLSAAPAGSNLVPVSTVPVSSVSSYISPCGSSCFYSGQGVAPISQFASAPANLVAYNSPILSVPVVVPKEDTGYQYSYVVYDEHTGDHKAQREHSDGSVVRGEYSFVQPDGYVREVQYVADDLNGFNAIVKNYLPASVGEVKVVEHIEKKIPVPCIEVKNEPFIEVQEIIEPETHEAVIELITDSHHSEHVHHVPSEEVHHHEHSDKPHHTEGSHHNDPDVMETHHSHSSEEHHDQPEESHHVHDEKHGHPEEVHEGHIEESHHDQHGHSEETQRSHSNEHHIEVVEIVDCAHGQVHGVLAHEESHNAHLEEPHHAHSNEKDAESSEEEDDGEETKDEHHGHSEHHQEHNEEAHHDHPEGHEVEGAHGHSEGHENVEENHSHITEHGGAHDVHSENHHEPEEKTHHSHTEVVLIEEEGHPEHTEAAHHTEHGDSNTHVSYEKVINCVQSAVEQTKEASSAHKVDTSSPTYIILNKPC